MKSARILTVVILILLTVPFLSCAPDQDAGRPKVVIISLDGMADWLLDYLLEQGHMPNIQRVIDNGMRAEHAITTFPAKTAVAHCSLWTGTNPSYTGINANGIVLPPWEEHSCVETVSGYNADGLQAEPIWSAVSRQDRKAVVVQATQNIPFSFYLGQDARFPADPDNILMFDGYYSQFMRAEFMQAENGLSSADDWVNLPDHNGPASAFSAPFGDSALHFLFFDDPADPVSGFDTIRICAAEDGSTGLDDLKPAPPNPQNTENFSKAIDLLFDEVPAKIYFRLFDLAPDGSSFKLFHTQAHHHQSTDPEAERDMYQSAGGFVGNAGDRTFLADGIFGPTVFDGGDGTAERAFVESVRHSIECFSTAMQHALKAYPFDMLIGYIPYPDGPNHAWLGYVAPPAGSVDHPIGKKIWPYLLDVYTAIDDYVGAVYDAMPDDAYLVIVSDHGFASTPKYFHANQVLASTGLLEFQVDENGRSQIDPSKTKALYFPGNGSFVFVNDECFKDGIVSADERDAVLRAAKVALLTAQDDDGMPIVEAVFTPEQLAELNMSGPYAGDLYVTLKPGYYFSSWPTDDGSIVSTPLVPAGNHYGDPRWWPMHSIFLVGGKRGPINVNIEEMRSVDLAPTVSAMLGIAPPAQATGTSRDELVKAVLAQAKEAR